MGSLQGNIKFASCMSFYIFVRLCVKKTTPYHV